MNMSDWNGWTGSQMYRDGLASGLIDFNGSLYHWGDQGFAKLNMTTNMTNGAYGFYADGGGSGGLQNWSGIQGITGVKSREYAGAGYQWHTVGQGNVGTQPEQRWDVDHNGQLWQIEANRWYRIGNGKSIRIAASSVNLKNVSPDLVKGMKISTPLTIKLLTKNFFSDGTVFGTLDAIYLGHNEVRILPNRYDFEIGEKYGHPWKGEFGRNLSTWIGGQVATGFGLADGRPKPYLIIFSGTATLGKGPK